MDPKNPTEGVIVKKGIDILIHGIIKKIVHVKL